MRHAEEADGTNPGADAPFPTSATTTELNQRLADVRTTYPDGRTRQHKQAVKHVYENTIATLTDKLSKGRTCFRSICSTVREQENILKQLKREMRILNTAVNNDNDTTPSCSICMEDMCGRVTLICGHELCPDCFAQHSRVNNTCPFCREEFAPKPKIQSKMPIAYLEHKAESLALAAQTTNYFTRHRIALCGIECESEADRYLELHMTIYGQSLMKQVKEWYDKDIP